MNFLGIGPGELILVLIILLIVVGPERLPEFARQAGRLLVRTRNWLQKSPDAALVLRARQEIEQELATLRMNLVEVQNVRNEVLEAAKQINQTVNTEVIGEVQQDLDQIKGAPGTIGRTPSGQPVTVPEAAGDPAPAAVAADPPPEQTIAPPGSVASAASDPEAAAAPPLLSNGSADLANAPTSAPASAADLIQLRQELQAISADLLALRSALIQRGVLNDATEAPTADQLGEAVGAPAIQAEEQV